MLTDRETYSEGRAAFKERRDSTHNPYPSTQHRQYQSYFDGYDDAAVETGYCPNCGTPPGGIHECESEATNV